VPDGDGLLEEVELVDQSGGEELVDDRHRPVQRDAPCELEVGLETAASPRAGPPQSRRSGGVHPLV
jgi:hypothetical protein